MGRHNSIDSKDSVSVNFKDTFSTSSSNDSGDSPVVYTGTKEFGEANDGRAKEDEGPKSREGSFSGKRLSFGSYSAGTDIIEKYKTSSIYEGKDEKQIALERIQSVRSILHSLDTRAKVAEEDWQSSKVLADEKYVEGEEDVLPETAVPDKKDGLDFQSVDRDLVTWDGPNDVLHPRNWTAGKKAYITLFVSLYTLVSPMSSSMPSPAVKDIAKEFGIHSSVISSMIISIQILAWAVGPLVITPLSEYDQFGRKLILDVSIWMSFFFNIGCAFSKNTTQILVFRFVGGLFGSTPLNVGAGVIADMYDAKSRNSALAAFTIGPVLGPVLAPVIAGFISEKMQWRWVFYILCIFNGAVAITGTLFYRETFAPKILKQKANYLRKTTGNTSLHTIHEITNGEPIWRKMLYTMQKPIKLLFTHPLIVGLGAYMAFTYGFMYLMIVTFPTVYEGQYGFSKGITGLMYLPMGFGFSAGIFFWTYMLNRTYSKLTAKNNNIAKPEYRLPCLCFTGIGIAIGLVWYGWSVQYKLHWIMPSIGSAIFAFTFIGVFQATQNYIIDINPMFTASSVAAAAVFRSIFGFALPLAAAPMYKSLTYGWGNTMCGLIAVLLGTPFPVFCYFYGERVRIWINKKLELEQLSRDRKLLQSLQNKK